MNKFDRCIFISIAVCIWALAMVHLYKPEPIQAGFTGKNSDLWLSTVKGKCPDTTGPVTNVSGDMKTDECTYILSASYGDLLKHPEYFW